MIGIPTKSCGFCNGSGTQIDHQMMGAILKEQREEKQRLAKARGEVGQYSLEWMANRLGLSPMYISDLEHGNRRWTIERIESYQKELQ